MPRRREVPKRELLPDPVYGSPLVTKFVNTVMKAGKRSTAEAILGSLPIGGYVPIGKDAIDDIVKAFKLPR